MIDIDWIISNFLNWDASVCSLSISIIVFAEIHSVIIQITTNSFNSREFIAAIEISFVLLGQLQDEYKNDEKYIFKNIDIMKII